MSQTAADATVAALEAEKIRSYDVKDRKLVIRERKPSAVVRPGAGYLPRSRGSRIFLFLVSASLAPPTLRSACRFHRADRDELFPQFVRLLVGLEEAAVGPHRDQRRAPI
jgi:hypothetical protein